MRAIKNRLVRLKAQKEAEELKAKKKAEELGKQIKSIGYRCLGAIIIFIWLAVWTVAELHKEIGIILSLLITVLVFMLGLMMMAGGSLFTIFDGD